MPAPIDDGQPGPDLFAVDGVALLEEGERAWQTGRFDEAEALFRRLAEQFPDHPEGYNKVGVVLAQRGDRREAQVWFQHALAIDATYPPALTNLGNVLLEDGRVDDAVTYYTLALQHNPSYSPAHRNLAVALRRQGRIFESVRHLRRSDRLETGYLSNFGLANPVGLPGSAPRPPGSSRPKEGRRSSARSFWIWLLVAAVVVTLVRLMHR
jgi:tetratricopeptide (TPR) repeat protein